MITVSTYPEADVLIEELTDGNRAVSVVPKGKQAYIHSASCVTPYPEDLIRFILSIKGPSFLCDEIMRDVDPFYVRRHLTLTICAHESPQAFTGKRILDFGCGSGASTVILAQLLPNTIIVGIELEADLLEIAERRAKFYKLENVIFQVSPTGDQLPIGLGKFDSIVLSAVYEHLLPNERGSLLPLLWSHLEPGGTLFIDETPFRWFPIETHTTGLPLINYLPNRIALAYSRHCSNRVANDDTWESLLRKGIRGSSVKEILRSIKESGGGATLLKPNQSGIHDWVDLWFEGYAANSSGRYASLKKYSKLIFRAFYSLTGVAPIPYLSLAVRKGEG